MKYRLTEAALEDIRQITRHIRIEQKSPQNAKLVAVRLRAHFRALVANPGIGHIREELQDDSLRFSSVTGLLVIYDPNVKPLVVFRVVHPARDLRRVDPRP
jgi:plasmid stabilization system protein ParE